MRTFARFKDIAYSGVLRDDGRALAVGGQAEATELTERERQICAALAPALRAEGLFFVGIDVIGGMLSEINVTSPTGIREVERLMQQPLADQTMDRLQALV